jgi:hypothetical protein
VISMRLMFYKAYSYKNQDLSSWNVNNVSNHEYFVDRSGGGNTEPNW